MKCRVCSGHLAPLLQLPNMPSLAQKLPDWRNLSRDRGITLEIAQCTRCALVQLTNEPVWYWTEVIHADVSQETRNFRSAQLSGLKKDWNLERIIEIGSDPGATTLEFDGFLLLHSLEHVPEPNKLLAKTRQCIRDYAVGIVEVPNFDMILEKNKVSEFMLDHLMYFTAATLRSTLETNGFDVLGIRTVFNNYVLSATVRKRKLLDLSGMVFDGAAIRKFMDGRSTAIWGAGHQALATMSLLGLDERKIKYVVDSAPAKQGRYTPVTHIPIVPPETLAAEPVEALLVMCGSYSEEVAGIAKRYNIANVMVV